MVSSNTRIPPDSNQSGAKDSHSGIPFNEERAKETERLADEALERLNKHRKSLGQEGSDSEPMLDDTGYRGG